MSIFAIADLHLAQSIDKPMDIFGMGWLNYMEKIKESWEQKVKKEDTVIIPGDISWATYLDEAYEDFNFVNSLPGEKIVLKGNHDYWWTTLSKLNKYLKENDFNTIKFLQNNSYEAKDKAICGTRGWKCPGDEDFSLEDRKIYERELQRLELSLNSIRKDSGKNIIAALHFSPFNSKLQPSGFVEIMKKYEVSQCVYGHIHGEACKNAFQGEFEGISFKLVSSDYLKFEPLLLS